MKKIIYILFLTFLYTSFVFSASSFEETKKSAEQGDAQAQYNLGLMYYKGDGVIKDLTEAINWCRKAAEQGDVQAQYNLGTMYDKGDGVEKDLVEAAKWYRKAAEQGHAQRNLAIMYAEGDGVQKNDIEAYAWSLHVGMNGENQLKEHLEKKLGLIIQLSGQKRAKELQVIIDANKQKNNSEEVR